MEHEDSDVKEKTACPSPDCGSSDAYAIYDDGHGHCYSCGHHVHGDGDQREYTPKPPTKGLITDYQIQRIPARGLNFETCEKWKYGVGGHKGKTVQIANLKSTSGQIVAQKLRDSDKNFTILGDIKQAEPLHGMSMWRDNGKMVVITEGEIDALSVSQVFGNKYPVVTPSSGSQSTAKAVSKAIEWLEGFDSVVFFLDDDEPGREALEKSIGLLSYGKAKVAKVEGCKDANEALLKHGPKAVLDAIWGATAYVPEGIVSLSDLRDKIAEPVEVGMAWWLPELTEATFGRRFGEVYCFGAGTGIGKTDFLTQQVVHDITVENEKVALFYFEQEPLETAKRVLGKFAQKRFHVPDGSWTTEELMAAFEQLEATDRLRMFGEFGCTEWDRIEKRIRFLCHSEGIRIFYVDHLTALATGGDKDEKKELERLMARVGSLVKELNIMVHLVSHLTTPDGKPHEEGGRVSIRHFKGSRGIGYWCHFMFGMERDTQADDPEVRKITTFRVLKDRFTGQANGLTIPLTYDAETGLILLADLNDDLFEGEDEADGQF